MNPLRRFAAAAIMLALVWCASAQAQVLKQVPADPFVVIKINKPQAISDKVAALAQRLGVANMVPGFADPLGMVKQQLNIKEGLDGNGEMAIAIYEPGQANPNEPQGLVLIPVTDYKAFLGNLANVQAEGNLSKFQLPNEPQPMYAANWGNYAAITPSKDLLANAPTGVNPSAMSAKQLDSADIVAWANMPKIRSVLVPMWQGVKPMALQQLDAGLGQAGEFNQKYGAAIKALVNQLFNVMESGLNDTAGATFGINIAKEGINTTLMVEFAPETYMGKILANAKGDEANLLVGLPNRKYFVVGGMTVDSAVATKMFSDFSDPIAQALGGAGPAGQPILNVIKAAKETLSATTGGAGGYVEPTGAPGQQSVLEVLGVYRGDAKRIAAANRESQAAMADLMQNMPQQPGISFKYGVQPGAKTIDGVTLDEVTMKFQVDPNNPAAVQAGQMIQMMYGPNGLSGAMGAVDDKMFLFGMGTDDALLSDAVAAAKKQDNSLTQKPNIAAVAKALPQDKIMVEYIFLDNIGDTVTKYMAQFGFPVKVKIPQDLPPIGVALTASGPSMRVDTHISTDLIESVMATVFQVMMNQQGGRPGRL